MFALANFFGYAGAEMRAISAIDIALWDIAGQHAGQPIYNLLGGRNRDQIPVYNTCVGYGKYPDYTAWMEGQGRRTCPQSARPGNQGDEDLALRSLRLDSGGAEINAAKFPVRARDCGRRADSFAYQR